VRTRSKQNWIKVVNTGRVSVFRDPRDPHRFEVSWKKPDGSYGRRRFSAETRESAIEQAPVVAGLIYQSPLPTAGLEVGKAFAQALAMTNRKDRSRNDWLREQVRFMEWLADHYPEVTHWQMIGRQMIREYIQAKFEGRSPNRIRLGLNPVVQTAGFMEREFGMANVTTRLGIGTRLVRPTPLVYLNDVLSFLKTFQPANPRLAIGAELQALAGLRMTEALRLTWDRVDLERGLIEISGEVKNASSARVIPVCRRLLKSLKALARTSHVEGPVVMSPKGCSYADGQRCWNNYSHRLKAAFKAWNPAIEWAPKDLRNCLPQFWASTGRSSDISEQYLGHTPKTVTGRHYIARLSAVSKGEAEALDRQMNLFRQLVIEPLDEAIARDGSAEILNIFEPKQKQEGA
jgi:integrase